MNSRNWYRDGEQVKALYMGTVQCEGTVLESRVKYGGRIQHRIEIKHDLRIPDINSYYPAGSTILVEEEQIIG